MNSESYRYDAGGNLKQVTLSLASVGTTTLDYLTDASDRRVGKKRNGALERIWVYGARNEILAELNSSGAMVSRFVYGSKPNVPDYMIRSGVSYKFITDQIGSIRLVVSASDGSIAEKIDYDEFGNVLSDSNPGFQPFGFAGGLYDQDTKLLHFGAREYDAEVGRWLSKDPILFDGGDTNLFSYVLQDPINLTDPSGKDFSDAIDVFTGIAVTTGEVLTGAGAMVILMCPGDTPKPKVNCQKDFEFDEKNCLAGDPKEYRSCHEKAVKDYIQCIQTKNAGK